MNYSEILFEHGEDRPGQKGAVTPPIYQSSNFSFPDVNSMRESLKRELDIPFYTRGNNPTVEILRKKVAALEGAEDALVFGSGSAAISSAILSQVKAGDHIVCVQKPYSWTHTLLTQMLSRFGVTSTFIDGSKIEEWEKAIQPNTRLFVLESPNSVTFEMQDIPAVAAIAKAKSIRTLLDNSYATPLLQRPLEMGIDMVCHSASKYFSGHSDVVAGVLCASRELIEHVFHGEFMTLGGIISPNDAWLILRGLRTLEIRLQRHGQTAVEIVDFLENHPAVKKVYFPFSKQNPQYDLAKKLMKGPAGQFSVDFNVESMEQLETFCNSLKYFLLACSWGGYESLIFPTCTLYDSPNYGKTTLPWTLVRFFVGLEDPEELKQDLIQAFEKAGMG